MKYYLILIVSTLVILISGCQKHMGYTDCRFVRGYCNGSAPIANRVDSYIGEFLNGKRNGYGTYTWANGNKYIGNWSNDQANGNGTYYYSGGTIYSGNMLNGRFHGYGKINYKNPDWSKAHPDCQDVIAYEGQFNYGSFNGQGTFTYKDGSKVSGEFRVCTLISNNSKNIKEETSKTNVVEAKKECLSLGFKNKSEKFRECVMELLK